jgi:predicted DCC family thiol-disulfide oxidoreductase YuxK
VSAGPPRVGLAPLRAYFDDACPRCAKLAARGARRGGEVAWCRLSEGEGALRAAGIDPAAARERLHVVDAEGRVASGAAALAAIWRRDPRRRGLARFVTLPLIRNLAERAYDLVARRRRREA